MRAAGRGDAGDPSSAYNDGYMHEDDNEDEEDALLDLLGHLNEPDEAPVLLALPDGTATTAAPPRSLRRSEPSSTGVPVVDNEPDECTGLRLSTRQTGRLDVKVLVLRGREHLPLSGITARETERLAASKVPWVFGGVVSSVGEVSTSKHNNQPYRIIRISDLKETEIPLFLFGTAYTAHGGAVYPGCALAVVTPTAKSGTKGPGDFFLSVSKPDQIVIIGRSMDFATCRGTRASDGRSCGQVVDARKMGGYCRFHVNRQLQQVASHRMSISASGPTEAIKVMSSAASKTALTQRKANSTLDAHVAAQNLLSGRAAQAPAPRQGESYADGLLRKCNGDVSRLSMGERLVLQTSGKLKSTAPSVGAPASLKPAASSAGAPASQKPAALSVGAPSPGVAAPPPKRPRLSPDGAGPTRAGLSAGSLNAARPVDGAFRSQKPLVSQPAFRAALVTPPSSKLTPEQEREARNAELIRRTQVLESELNAPVLPADWIAPSPIQLARAASQRSNPNLSSIQSQLQQLKRPSGLARPSAAPASRADGKPSAFLAAFQGKVDVSKATTTKSAYADLAEEDQARRTELRVETLAKHEEIAQEREKITSITVKGGLRCETCGASAAAGEDLAQCRARAHALKRVDFVKSFWECVACKQRAESLGTLPPKGACGRCGKTSYKPRSAYSDSTLYGASAKYKEREAFKPRGEEHAFSLR